MQVNEYRYHSNKGEEVPKSVPKLIVIPGIHVLPDHLCHKCELLQDITLPEGLLKIGEGAFFFCNSLLAIKICSTVESIEGSRV